MALFSFLVCLFNHSLLIFWATFGLETCLIWPLLSWCYFWVWVSIAHFHHESRNCARVVRTISTSLGTSDTRTARILVLTNAGSAPLTAHCLNAEVILAQFAFWAAKNRKFTLMASVECWCPGATLVRQLLFHLGKEHLAAQSKCLRANQCAWIN